MKYFLGEPKYFKEYTLYDPLSAFALDYLRRILDTLEPILFQTIIILYNHLGKAKFNNIFKFFKVYGNAIDFEMLQEITIIEA